MAKVNVICLTPVKNEAWILDRFLRCASLWADHIIIADQMSDDGSREIARRHQKVTLIENSSPTYSELERQKLLLEAARRLPGPKLLVALDADEMLTSNFLTSQEWNRVLEAPAGSVIHFKWLNLLPGAKSYWSPDYHSPFGFMDDGSEHVGAKIHSNRIPMPKGAPAMHLKEVKVLHYQYMNWQRMESKHRWYQCWERRNNPDRHPIEIYREYHHMYSVNDARIHPVQSEWLSGYEQRGIDMTSVRQDEVYWWDREILKFLAEDGANAFKREAIWDVDWLERSRMMNSGLQDCKFTDPRGFSDKLVQWWLKKTQPKHARRSVRGVDRVLKAIYQ
jgi:hypothetical protein